MLAPSHLRANKGQNGSQPRIGKEENHMTKSLLLIATLALAGIASAKTYDNMVIPAPTLVSGQEMAAGEYSIQLKGDTAVFTSIDTDRSYTASVRVENSTKKFDRTAIRRAVRKSSNGSVWAAPTPQSSSKTKMTKSAQAPLRRDAAPGHDLHVGRTNQALVNR
jgi:hypothetical protein